MSTRDPQDLPATPLAAAADRQATGALRGFAYQIWRALLAWFRLAANETLVLEGAEDFDLLAPGEARAVQVKDLARSVTLASEPVLEAIAHYWEHHQNNPALAIQYHLLTTATRGFERDGTFGDKRGLDYWDECRTAGTDLGPLREFLATRRFPVQGRAAEREHRESLIAGLVEFIATAPDDELRTHLVRPVHWHTGSDTQQEVERAVEDAAILHGAERLRLNTVESRKAVSQLLRHVWAVASRPNPQERRLTFVDLLVEFERATMVLVPQSQTLRVATLEADPARDALAVSEEAPTDPEEPWKTRLATAREIQKAGAPRTALRLLERDLDEALAPGSTASPLARAKILNNIAAAHLDLVQPDAAVDALRRAVDYAPEDATMLANLAQAELVAGVAEDALRHAEAAIGRSPESRTAWSVRIQASPRLIPDEEIPAVLRTHPEILAAKAMAIFDSDRPGAIAALREAIRTGPREPQLLALLGETLYSALFPRRVADPIPLDEVRSIKALGAEAATRLEGTERVRLLSRALVVQGAAEDLLGETAAATEHFERAMAIDPSHTRARFAAARNQMQEGNAAAAIYLLDGVREDARGAEWHTLRAAVLLLAGHPEAVEAEVRLALAKLDPAHAASIVPRLADAVVDSGQLGIAGELLERLEAIGHYDQAHLLRARIAIQQADEEAAEREYDVAIGAASEAVRPALQVEFASYLHGRGKHDRAVELFDASGAVPRDTRATRLCARSLYALQQWHRLTGILDELRAAGDLPAWAVDLQARIAMKHEDLPAATAALEHLVRRQPKNADARLRYAHVLLRQGRTVEAAEVLLLLEGRDDLDPTDRVNLAQMLVDLGKPQRALELAYRTLRESPDDADLQSACIVGVFFRAADHAPADLFVASEVRPDTWVALRAADGEKVQYLILAGGPHDVRRNELLADDPRARPFLGLREGDPVVLREGAANEKEFVVVELKTALLHTFHDAMIEFQVRFPGRTDLQMVHVGTGETFDPWPVYRMILRAGRTGQEVRDLYLEHRLPFGVLAAGGGHTLRRTYLRQLASEDPKVYVEEPSEDRLEAALAQARRPAVVLTATGLTTLQILGRLDLLPNLYEHLIVPQTLVDELNREVAHWEEAQRHGGYMTADTTPDHTIEFVEVDRGNVEAALLDVRTLREFVLDRAEIAALPLVDDGHGQARELLGASSADALALAMGDAALHADDWGLRHYGSARGVGGFSTYAMLKVAHERGRIMGNELNEYVIRLVSLGHTFIPIDAQLLHDALLRSGYQFDAPVLRMLDRLTGPEASVESAVGVAVEFFRALVLSPLGNGALAAATAVTLERLAVNRDAEAVALRVLRQANSRLQLLPRELAVVRDRVIAFITARRLMG